MNKSQLIESMAHKMDVDKEVAENSLNAFIDTITEALQNGEKVNIIGFGTFELRDRKPRKGVNPRTGESVDIAASKMPALKIGQAYKKLFNE